MTDDIQSAQGPSEITHLCVHHMRENIRGGKLRNTHLSAVKHLFSSCSLDFALSKTIMGKTFTVVNRSYIPSLTSCIQHCSVAGQLSYIMCVVFPCSLSDTMLLEVS